MTKYEEKNIARAREYLSRGDAGKDYSVAGSSRKERLASLARILDAQKRTHHCC